MGQTGVSMKGKWIVDQGNVVVRVKWDMRWALSRRELGGSVGKEDQRPQKPMKGGNSASSETIAFSLLNMALISSFGESWIMEGEKMRCIFIVGEFSEFFLSSMIYIYFHLTSSLFYSSFFFQLPHCPHLMK